jgi:hypothetical protein
MKEMAASTQENNLNGFGTPFVKYQRIIRGTKEVTTTASVP